MRVALLTDGIWPYVLGGMQKHSFYLCKYLAQNNIQVHLFHFNQSEYNIEALEFFSEQEKKFITAIVIPFPKSSSLPGHYVYDSYRYSKLVFEAMAPHLQEYNFIYSKGFTGWHLLKVRELGKIKTPPIAVKFHGYEMFQPAPSWKVKLQQVLLLRNPVSYISRQADLVFSYGGKITALIKSLGVKNEKIFELPSGVEASTLINQSSAIHTPLRLLFLGRYERRKGVEELNVVIKDLLRQNGLPEFEMHFIGPIPEAKKIRHGKVIYHGEIRDKSTLINKIKDCDVLLCPSWSEGLPNVLLEAMANGLTVLATDVGAVSVLVNSSNGFLIEKASTLKIKAGLIQILNSTPKQLNEMKKNALNTIREKFTWEKLTSELIQIIVKSIGDSKVDLYFFNMKFFVFIFLSFLFIACTKDSGKLPGPNFKDVSFLDSINSANSYNYYKNDSIVVLSGAHGPHGPFKLRFNTIAFNALTDNGKLPSNIPMPSGGLVIKELINSNSIITYYYMYKYQNSWLWGKIDSDKTVGFSIYNNASNCTNCHQQSGNRDLIVAFNFY